ncbi:arginine-tRNA-protein transferase [Ochromonadaceae sp. CCMP2298]|nr:arginine-tRNA-protein transferase [Ochromonadaceae sp. CCMP2298]
MSFASISRVSLAGEQAHECGYCKSTADTSLSYGAQSSTMTAEDYETLMLVGWRRSGTYFYKPAMHLTCCPQYPIRLPVAAFKMGRSHKKVLKGVRKFLSTPAEARASATEAKAVVDGARDGRGGTSTTAPTAPTSAPPAPSLTVELERACFSAEKFSLYRKYQTAVHGDAEDAVTERGFTRFLVRSPLKDTGVTPRLPRDGDGTGAGAGAETGAGSGGVGEEALCGGLCIPVGAPLTGYGSYHQLYRLDGALIAVGVLDVLPTGFSSVYLFYDSSLKEMQLGKLSALVEIEQCARLGLPYYYMGFYVHRCEKMNYKAAYQPSELLCPTTLQWFTHALVKPLLDRPRRFSPLHPQQAARLDLLLQNKGQGAGQRQGAGGRGPTGVGAGSASAIAAETDAPAAADFVDELAVLDPMDFSSFAPQFQFQSQSQGTQALSAYVQRVPLDVGADMCIYLRQLQDPASEQLTPLLEQWLRNVGPDAGGRITLSFS